MPYTYSGTPSDRLEQARARISDQAGSDSSDLASYLTLAAQGHQQLQEVTSASFWDKVGDTLGDIVHNVFKGTQKAVEGILDFGATIVGEIAGAVGDEKTKQGAADFIARDLTGEYDSEVDMRSRQILGKSLFADSAVNEMSATGQQIVRGVAQGVGQMAPMIVSGYFAGAAGAGAVAAQAATYAPLFGSAFGNATEEALNDTDIFDENGNVIGKRNVSLDRAALYGLASGALEVATESLVGGIWSTGAKGVLDPVVSRLASSVRFGNAVKFVADAVGEGVEEVVGAAFENTLKTIYKNENGHMSWEDPNIQDMIVSGVIGSLTAATMNVGNVATRKVSTTAFVADNLAIVSEMDSRADALAAEGKLTEKKSAALERERTRAIDKLVSRYTNASEKTRTKLWDTYWDQLKAYVNEDGTPVEIKLNEGVKAIETGDSAVISPSLKSMANAVANVLASQQSTLANNLNETETDVIRSLQKAGRAVGAKLGMGGLKFVVFDGADNGFIDGDVVYINRNRLANKQDAANTFAHEAWHFSEGSVEHKALYNQLLNMTDRETGKTLLQLAVEDVRKSTASAIGEGGYPISEEVLAEIENGDLTYDDLFGAKGSERGLAVSEIGAHMAEHLLTNQEMIDDLAMSDRSTARKVLDRIKDTIDALKAWLGGDAENYQAYKEMVKARKMFEDALAKAGQMTAITVGKSSISNEGNETERNAGKQYNPREYIKDLPTIVLSTNTELSNLIKKAPRGEVHKVIWKYIIANYGDDVFKLTDGNTAKVEQSDAKKMAGSLSARNIAEISDLKRIVETATFYKESPSYKAKDKYSRYRYYAANIKLGDDVYDLSVNVGVKRSDGSFVIHTIMDYEIEKSGAEDSINQVSTGSKYRISVDSATNSIPQNEPNVNTEIKKSVNPVRDSDGRTLTPEQQAYFADSKVVDEQGNLLVVYHGTNSEFFVFDSDKIRIDNLGRGFYFVDSKEIADSYANRRTRERGGKERIVSSYLNAVKPFEVDNVTRDQAVDYLAYDYLETNKEASAVDAQAYAEELANDKELVVDGKPNYGLLVNTKEDSFQRWLKDRGYDALIVSGSDKQTGLEGTAFIVFSPNQIKLTTNEHPTTNPDIRFSVNPDAKPSKGSKKRTIAQLTEDYRNLEIAGADLRIYTKADAKKVYASVMSLLTADVKDGQIYGKAVNKKAIIDSLYMTLNEAEEGGRYVAARDIADYIISVALAEDTRIEAEHQADLDLVSAGKRYLHNIKWSEKLDEEARHKFDTRYPAIKKAWAAEDGGINHDEFVDTLSSDTGEVFGLDADNEYAVIEFIDNYYKAMDRAVKAKHTKLVDVVGEEQLGAIREEISRTIYDAYKTYGRSAAPVKRMIENAIKAVDLASMETQEALQAAADATANADKRIAEMEQKLKDTVKKLRNENMMVNRCLDDAKRLAALSAEERSKPVGPGVTGYHSATVLTNPHISALLSGLASVKNRGDVLSHETREKVATFANFYVKPNGENSLLEGVYDESIQEDIDLILANKDSDAKLSIEELTALHHILKHAEYLAANIDRVSFRGKTKSITETSKAVQKEINDFAGFNVKRNTGVRGWVNKYANYISEPRVVLEALVGYKKDAELMQLFDDLTIGETGYNSMLARMQRIWIDFQRQNKSYIKRLAKEKVTIGGDTITKGEAVYLAMLCLQEDSRTKLQKSGYYTYDKTRSIKHEALSDGDINELMNSLTAQDRDLMDAARKVYDYATDAHIKTDKDLHGFSDIEDNPNPYYVHEMVAGENLPSTADNNGGSANASAANVGLSKKRRGSKLSLAVTDIFDALQVFAEDEAKYCNMAVPAKNFELVYNRNTSLTPEGTMDTTNVKSIHTAVAAAWREGDKYITKWLQDVQGFTNKSYDPMRKLANRVYSNFVTASLGMNIKVVFSQFASYPAAAMYINPISMMRAMVTGYGKGNIANLDKYSDWAFARNATNGAVVALSLQDKMSKFVELTTKGISAMDRITIGRIWTACQIEVERSQGLKRGTEANLKAAAEMLEDVGRRTQPNYTQSERSALQRGDTIISMLAKPFTSVATKYASRFIEAVGALQAANYAKKNGIETTISQAAAVKQLARTAASLAAANAMFALIVEFVKHILNKDRKEKKDGTEMTVWEDLLAEFASASVGMLPVVNDLYEQIFSWAVQGKRYSTGDNFATSAFNDVLDSTFALGNLAETMFSGKEVDSEKVNAALKKSIIAIGKAFGLPMSNTYNLAYGLVKRFDEGAAYEWDVRFGSSSYQKDLKKAIQEGNDDLADTIFSLMVSDKGISGVSSSVNSYLRDLYGKYTEDQAKAMDEREGIVNFLPKAANGSFSWNGTTITLTAAEQKKFTSVYAEASKAVEALLTGDGFKSLSSSTQASAVKTIFDYYYDRAKYTVMDQEFDSKKLLFGDAMGIEKLSLAAASASEFRAGLSDNLNDAAKRVRLVNYLVRLGLTARERAMVLAYMGYGVSDYCGILLSTARQLGYTGDQLKAWKNACGIA